MVTRTIQNSTSKKGFWFGCSIIEPIHKTTVAGLGFVYKSLFWVILNYGILTLKPLLSSLIKIRNHHVTQLSHHRIDFLVISSITRIYHTINSFIKKKYPVQLILVLLHSTTNSLLPHPGIENTIWHSRQN